MRITYKKCLEEGYKSGMGIISYYITKPLQCFIAYMLIKITKGKINPNLITVSNLLIFPFTAYFIMIKKFVIAALILWLVHDLLDGVDGCVARALNKTSNLGHFLDNLIYTLIYYFSLLLIGFVSNNLLYVSLLFFILLSSKTVRLVLEESKYREEIIQIHYSGIKRTLILHRPTPDVIYFSFFIASLTNNIQLWFLFLILFYIVSSLYEGTRLFIKIIQKYFVHK